MKKFNGRKLLALMMTLIMLLSLMPTAKRRLLPPFRTARHRRSPPPLRLSRRLSRSTSPRSATSSMRLWTMR